MTTNDSIEIFAGIDVSKANVDVCVLNAEGQQLWSERVPRKSVALQQLAARLGPQCCAVLEATGGLEALPAALLETAGIRTVVENPAKMRHYALSHGLLEKTDRLDARVLAEFARERRPRPRRRRDTQQQAVAKLVTRRSQLVGLRATERIRLRGENDAFCHQSIGAVIEALSKLIAACEQQIRQQVEASPQLLARAALLRTAPGVGEWTAYALLAWLPELGECNRGEIAKLAGVAPLVQQSGQWRGQVKIRGGRARVRSALYMASLSTVRRDGYWRDFYLRLLTRGKEKKVGLIAVAHKLLLVLNQMVAHGCPWDSSYSRHGIAA
jgi:transposase